MAKSRVIFAECFQTIPVMRESQGVHIPPALVISVYLVFHKGVPLIPVGRDKFPVVPLNDKARFLLQAQERKVNNGWTTPLRLNAMRRNKSLLRRVRQRMML